MTRTTDGWTLTVTAYMTHGYDDAYSRGAEKLQHPTDGLSYILYKRV